MKKIVLLILLSISIATTIIIAKNKHIDPKFQQFIATIKQEALTQGVSQKTVNKYLDSLRLNLPVEQTEVVKRQQSQPQAILTFQKYLHDFLTDEKVARARDEYQKNYPLLEKIQKKYHVQPQYIVALWGIESDFGNDTGNYPLVKSLATLAYHHHRSPFYRRQLIDALIMLDGKHFIPQMEKSAWDGGMGQAQFEPSTYLHYAVDFNGDGFKNIWTDLPDVFASIANFLHRNGWHNAQTWGIPVKIPNNFAIKLANRYILYSISTWSKLGVRGLDGKALQNIPGKHAILMPDGAKGPAYLTYDNFTVLLRWNNTTFESMVVGILADEIVRDSKG